MESYQALIDTPFGQIRITASEYYLQGIDLFATTIVDEGGTNTIIEQFTEQLRDFIVDPHNSWSIPLSYHGTDFQQAVWEYLRAIPIGQTHSYSQVASALNTSARAVGNACHANPFPIIVPCHRVVAKNGLGGFGGKTEGDQLTVKQWLLNHEQS